MQKNRDDIIAALLAKNKERLQIAAGRKPPVLIYWKDHGSENFYLFVNGQKVDQGTRPKSKYPVIDFSN